MIKTLIVDDNPLVRSIIKDFLESDGSFEIIGEAENGLDGVRQAQFLNPDLITMDIEMPVMNGLEAITEIKKTVPSVIVVISTNDTAKVAYDSVVKGALDFFSKNAFTSQMGEQQRKKILNTLKQTTRIRKRISTLQPTLVSVSGSEVGKDSSSDIAKTASGRIDAVVIAASTGGPQALCRLAAELPKDFPAPIILVQHNISGFDKGFVQWLDGYTPLGVHLVTKKIIPGKGNIYVAPVDKHLLLSETGFVLDDGKPIQNQKPAADVLFKSAAELYGKSLVSVVLTGMGRDGAEGTRHVKAAGGITIAQDESSSMIYGMPKAAAETGCVDMSLPLDAIAKRLIILTKTDET
ncbi:MAG: chemotaxis-specific protein-glutamate methyltransferase CheB [Leptospirales bacterium]|nr:chemotaxis-specific protein-glutamate methyltransferase CheB [Leptospirales bacterium]